MSCRYCRENVLSNPGSLDQSFTSNHLDSTTVNCSLPLCLCLSIGQLQHHPNPFLFLLANCSTSQWQGWHIIMIPSKCLLCWALFIIVSLIFSLHYSLSIFSITLLSLHYSHFSLLLSPSKRSLHIVSITILFSPDFEIYNLFPKYLSDLDVNCFVYII